MRVLTKEFSRLARKHQLDESRIKSVESADRGLIDAEIGNGLIRQRVARQGGGKSGGYRVVLYYRRGSRSVCLHLFSKNTKSNLDPGELEAYRDFARVLDSLGEEQFEILIERRGWRII